MTSSAPAAAARSPSSTALLPPGGVLTDPAELFVYECDGFTIAKARPAAVVFPTTTEEVVARRQAPRRARRADRPARLRHRPDRRVRRVRERRGRLDRADEPHPQDRPGQPRRPRRGRRAQHRSCPTPSRCCPAAAAYHFAPDPSSQRASTIGGNASTNAGGIHTLKDFVSSNHVLGMEMVLPDGDGPRSRRQERLLRVRPVRSARPDLRPRGHLRHHHEALGAPRPQGDQLPHDRRRSSRPPPTRATPSATSSPPACCRRRWRCSTGGWSRSSRTPFTSASRRTRRR